MATAATAGVVALSSPAVGTGQWHVRGDALIGHDGHLRHQVQLVADLGMLRASHEVSLITQTLRWRPFFSTRHSIKSCGHKTLQGFDGIPRALSLRMSYLEEAAVVAGAGEVERGSTRALVAAQGGSLLPTHLALDHAASPGRI